MSIRSTPEEIEAIRKFQEERNSAKKQTTQTPTRGLSEREKANLKQWQELEARIKARQKEEKKRIRSEKRKDLFASLFGKTNK